MATHNEHFNITVAAAATFLGRRASFFKYVSVSINRIISL